MPFYLCLCEIDFFPLISNLYLRVPSCNMNSIVFGVSYKKYPSARHATAANLLLASSDVFILSREIRCLQLILCYDSMLMFRINYNLAKFLVSTCLFRASVCCCFV